MVGASENTCVSRLAGTWSPRVLACFWGGVDAHDLLCVHVGRQNGARHRQTELPPGHCREGRWGRWGVKSTGGAHEMAGRVV